MLSDPTIIAILLGLCIGGVAIFTAPLWIRGLLVFVKGARHQLNDAGSAIDAAMTPAEEEKEKEQ